MSRIGKWSAVQEVDSRQLANVPMTPSNDFEDEIDMNPSAPRRPFWMDRNRVPVEKRESFHKDFVLDDEGFIKEFDVDTVYEDWCLKEEIVGAVMERRSSGDYTRWSIVVRTVIKWEEKRMRKIVVFNKTETVNKKPADIERAVSNGRFRSKECTNRIKRRIRTRRVSQ